MEKQIVAALVLLTLTSTWGSPAALAASEPVQIGRDKYEIEYGFFDTRRNVIEAANQFCKARGFAWMEEEDDVLNRFSFLCMRPGERTISRSLRTNEPVVVLPLH